MFALFIEAINRTHHIFRQKFLPRDSFLSTTGFSVWTRARGYFVSKLDFQFCEKKWKKIWPCSPSIALSLDKKATRLRRSKSKMRVIIAPDWCSGPATQGGQVGIARDLIFLFQKVGKLKKVENFQSIRRLSSPKSVKSELKKFT